MSLRRLFLGAVWLVWVTSVPQLLRAQGEPSRSRGAFGEITAGAASTRGGEYAERGSWTIDGVLAQRRHANDALNLLVGGWGGVTRRNGSTLTCFTTIVSTYCTPLAPAFSFVGALVGAELHHRSALSLALMTGPGFVHATQNAGTAFGAQFRADAAVSPVRGLAFVYSARTIVMPRFGGAIVNVNSHSFGLRVQPR